MNIKANDKVEANVVEPVLANGQAIKEIQASTCKNTISESDELSLSMVYAPYQSWQNLYDEETGLSRGTIFKDLDKPLCTAGR